MTRNVGLAAGFLAIVGCAGSTEVRGADDSESGGSTTEAETAPAPAASAAEGKSDSCDAGDIRACTQRYKDSYGTAHCLSATQFCSLDGTDWLSCGAAPSAGAK